jgi:hypothetical protein
MDSKPAQVCEDVDPISRRYLGSNLNDLIRPGRKAYRGPVEGQSCDSPSSRCRTRCPYPGRDGIHTLEYTQNQRDINFTSSETPFVSGSSSA